MEKSFTRSGDSRLRTLLRLMLLVSVGCVLAPTSRASAPEAIASYQWMLNPPVSGYLSGDAGFAFSPQTNIVVTSLGFGGASLADEPYRVSLWDTNGNRLAQAVVTTSSPVRNGTSYEAIQRFGLSAGVKYFLSAAGNQSGNWSGPVLSSAVDPVNGTFTVGPELSYLSAGLGTNAVGNFPLSEWPNTFLFVGANFEYATPPAVLLNGVTLTNGQAQVGFTVTGGPASSFVLFEATQLDGAWVANGNAILTTNVPDKQFTFSSSPQSQVRFFRVLAAW